MSTLSAGFTPTEIVETIEISRTYPKKSVISYLTGRPIADCFKGDGNELVVCGELKILIDSFGLLPLGQPRSQKFFGQHIIDAEIRRATNEQVASAYCRANLKPSPEKKEQNESVGSPEGSRRKTKGEK